ncbi:MAG: 3-deoxy-8-phosphooctulonate synthase [Elusimicrobiaceae bacterium]|uniref:2-dehydro-3-deoxyphosphooctonate aldolase n=1 Tax=Candidatus Avelusimicrobium gallicola TaxID=2562704 RepID=A0A928DPR0_9BACT|nr:3-deoxy-8-phosphooctulonate synthase [Elusimicrobium sp.]MBQ9970884.1 3-deoxy-8-phosphooctulonate synthase [Elusimicrobiaceae bacterium]
MQKTIQIGSYKISNTRPLSFMAGTCVIESEKHYLETAKKLKSILAKTKHPFILKASFDKANRTSVEAYRGPGLTKGLDILAKAKKLTGLPVVVDVHEPWQAEEAAQVADILQIPAFLCRQTDLVLACADTGRAINVKKGQFLAPGAMEQVIKKIESRGNKKILLTERGSSFGYGDLVVDMRSLQTMKEFGYPVIFDATHSVQKPGALGSCTGGNRQMAPILAKAATALGIAGVFFEAHPTPDTALSDGPNSLDMKLAEKMARELCLIDQVVKKFK